MQFNLASFIFCTDARNVNGVQNIESFRIIYHLNNEHIKESIKITRSEEIGRIAYLCTSRCIFFFHRGQRIGARDYVYPRRLTEIANA